MFPRVRIFYARPLMTKDARPGQRCIAVGLPLMRVFLVL